MVVAARPEAVLVGPQGAPMRSLGWAVAKWASTYLLQPDGKNAGKPWAFTEEQLRFLANWYEVDENGAFRYTYGVLRRAKGWGKDPLGAVLCAVEMVGPCRFGGWDAEGNPIAVPRAAAWVQTAGVAKEQTRNTMVLFPSLFSKKAIAEYGVDVGKEIIYAHGGQSQIQAVTSAPNTLEGARSTFVLLNETQHWLENNQGVAMHEAMRRNSAKVEGRALAITNAHRIGEASVAERDWEQWLEQGSSAGLLYDSREAPESTDLDDDDSLRAGLVAAYGDAWWAPIDRLMIEMRNGRDSESYRRRYYLNQIRSDRAGWIGFDEWDAAERTEEVPEGEWITVGFDGSRVRDATALVGTVITTGYQWVIGVWARPPRVLEWEVPADEVNAYVEETFRQYRVWRMLCDPYWWDETIAHWAGRYGADRVIEFRTNAQYSKLAAAVKSYETATRIGELGHPVDPVFREHVTNAVRSPIGSRDEDGEPLYVIAKENKNSIHKIDVAMAAVLSWEARTGAVAAGIGMSYGWAIR